MGSQARRQLGMALAAARRSAGLTQRGASDALDLPRTRISLIEAGRVRIERAQVKALLDTYSVEAERRPEILALADVAGAPVEADALSWITSHTFRKTTATILDNAGQSARQIADQLGHARPSMTQDVYMGRRTKNPGLPRRWRRPSAHLASPKVGDKVGVPHLGWIVPRLLPAHMVRHQGLEPRTR